MNLNLRSIDIDTIRTDGGTQVRAQLDEAWVEELADLYREGHDVAPVLVVIDPAGTVWLADGFHRVEAQRRTGAGALKATVRQGPSSTLDFAKMLAAEANKNGMQRTTGDKRRAVLMARSTPEGAAMGVRELARHCGVSRAYVGEILAERPVADTSCSSSSRSAASTKVQAAIHGDLRKRIDDALRADIGRADTLVAAEIGCEARTVRVRRAALDLPKSDPTRRRAFPARDRAEDVLRQHPEWPNAQIASVAGSHPDTIAKLRVRLSLPRQSVAPPSAPVRKSGDPRDGAEVLQARPASPAAAYSSAAVRDVAAMALRFGEADWALLMSQRAGAR